MRPTLHAFQKTSVCTAGARTSSSSGIFVCTDLAAQMANDVGRFADLVKAIGLVPP